MVHSVEMTQKTINFKLWLWNFSNIY
jgi:hypothetical protein